MNQAALHRLLALKKPKKKGKTQAGILFDQRFAANLSLIKILFFSLYEETQHMAYFYQLLDKLEVLFSERPAESKKQDILRLNFGNWYQNEKLVGMQLYVDRFN